jgi:acyl CoA:acetate/3-ketoacid CoA transferase beta subunit
VPGDDRSRLLRRAAREVQPEHSLWLGRGLPKLLERDLGIQSQDAGPVSIAVIEVQSVSGTGAAESDPLPFPADRIIALSHCELSALGELIRANTNASGTLQVSRLICPFAVIDFTDQGPLLREIRHGLTAADVQAELDMPLWSGPDLCELG